MRLPAGLRVTLWVVTSLVLLVIYVPLMLVLVNSFNSDRSFRWPPPGFTTKWWRLA